jgi:phosphatidylglycerophosphatase C
VVEQPLLTAISGAELVQRLEDLAQNLGAAVAAFDGDGTLWTGDVGEDLFHRAVHERWLLPEALPALKSAAEAHGLSSDGDANDVATRLFEAYLARRFPEKEICEVLTWCYAGHTYEEVEARARPVLASVGIRERLQPELEPVIGALRRAGVRTIVVSASPTFAVEPAAALWGFSDRDVAAACPRVVNGRITPEMGSPIPYAGGKVVRARELMGESGWLVAFGDNAFDIEMFQAARIGVAVRPKPALLERLPGLENTRVLEPPAPASAIVAAEASS